MSLLSFPRFSSNRRTVGSSPQRRRNRAKRLPLFEGLEDRICLTTDVWTGVAAKMNQDYNWSNINNWSNKVPVSGQDLIFPSANGQTFIPTHAINNDINGLALSSIEIDAPGYTIGGDAISLSSDPGLFTTYPAGVSTFSINTNLMSGDISISGGELDVDGTFTGSHGFVLSGAGTLGGTGTLPTLEVEGSAVKPGVGGAGKLTVNGGVNFDSASTFTTTLTSAGVNSFLYSVGSSQAVLQSPTLVPLVAAGYIPSPGTAFTIVQGNISGFFNLDPEGTYVPGGPSLFRITYDNGVVLTAVQSTATIVQTNNTISVIGQNVTFTATVTAAGTKPTGTVTFDDGSTFLATENVNSAGVATFTTNQLAIGAHSISASYGGDTKSASSTSAPISATVNQAKTKTSLASNANPSASGQTVTFTATVAPVSPGSGTATGTITFTDTSDPEFTPVVVSLGSAGTATYSTSALAIGAHPIVAVYSGDDNFIQSEAPTLTQNVNHAASVTTIVSSINPSVFGQAVTFTATVAPGQNASGLPTGSVNFFDGSSKLGNVQLTGNTATYTASNLSRGSHSITAAYAGDPNFGTSTSSVLTQNANQASTQTTVTPSPSVSPLGASVTFTAHVAPVSPGAGVPSGSLTFKDGTTSLGTITLTAGSASISTSALGLGSHSITAVYSGDGNDFLGSTSAPSIEVIGGTSVILASSTNPTTFGQSVTFTATVSASASGSGVPTGSVTFMDGTQSLGTFPLTSGVASVQLSSLTGGNHAITAVYSGNAQLAPNTSSPATQVVNPLSTITKITPSVSSGAFGELVTFSAKVTSTSGTPAGSVTFSDGGNVLATVPVGSSGIATYSSSSLAVGAHNVAAAFSNAAGSFGPSASSALTFNVARTSTSTVLTPSTPSPVVGQDVTFTATVAASSPGAGSPAGTVVFTDGSAVIGSAPLSAGTATLTVALSPAGQAHSIVASYGGSAGYGASTSSAVSESVHQAAPVTTLIATANFVGKTAKRVTFQVTVQATTSGGPVPGGSVTFDIGKKVLHTATLVNGSASVVVTSAKATGKSFLVKYRGDSNYTASVSNTIRIQAKFFKTKPKPAAKAIRFSSR